MAKGNGPPAGDELRLIIERAERVKEEIKEMQADLKDVFGEAKSRGFDVKTIQRVMRLRAMKPEQRREMSALDEIYMAALGMLDGSMSDSTRSFMSERHKAPDTVPPVDEEGQHDAFPTENKVPEDFGDDLSDLPPTDDPVSVEDAGRMGAKAARDGVPIMRNPFPAGSERRAAWDQHYCAALGGDGMEVPEELRAPSKKKKSDDADDKKKED